MSTTAPCLESSGLSSTSCAAPLRRGRSGDKLGAGERVLTATGRATSPFPRLDCTTNRKTAATLQRVDAWLHANAVAEAEARRDGFNGRSFRAANPARLTPAEKDSFEYYLFGDEQPPVLPSFLKAF